MKIKISRSQSPDTQLLVDNVVVQDVPADFHFETHMHRTWSC